MSQETAEIKTYTVEEIQTILEAHRKWCRDKNGGSRANLSGANLSRANLSRANLSGANLSGAKYGEDELRGFLQIGPIGSRKAILQVFGIGAEGFIFRAGCFTGSLEQFAAEVEAEHGENVHGVQYHYAIEFARHMLPVKTDAAPDVPLTDLHAEDRPAAEVGNE